MDSNEKTKEQKFNEVTDKLEGLVDEIIKTFEECDDVTFLGASMIFGLIHLRRIHATVTSRTAKMKAERTNKKEETVNEQ
jgi:uncharacterized NAD(P)/FAD-binding protein YdhS